MNIYNPTNLRHLYQLLILSVLNSLVSSIKVDFGTRGGPIVPPPPSTPSPPPSQPYREPAPVWEDQSNDISNPRPYVYQLPTPSRSRENTINIFDPNYKPPVYSTHSNNNPVDIPSFNQQHLGYSLVPIYIPNEGYRYFVVVPVEKWNYLSSNHIIDDQNSVYEKSAQKFDKYDKYNGRYNAKLKKYKAYEKFLKPTTDASVVTYNQQQQLDYSFRYYIDEPQSDGVSLDHWESKRSFDGVVTGGYGYRDPNGVARNVYYRVEGDKGFEAVIKTVTPGGLFYFQQHHKDDNNHQRMQNPKIPIQHAQPISFVN